jgi:hypothetical protein
LFVGVQAVGGVHRRGCRVRALPPLWHTQHALHHWWPTCIEQLQLGGGGHGQAQEVRQRPGRRERGGCPQAGMQHRERAKRSGRAACWCCCSRVGGCCGWWWWKPPHRTLRVAKHGTAWAGAALRVLRVVRVVPGTRGCLTLQAVHDGAA